MLKKNWNNVIFDEFFFYEFSRCQYRAACIANKNFVKNQYCPTDGKIKPIRAKTYQPYKDTLLYTIYKKIIFITGEKLSKGLPVDLKWFKKIAAIIIEKEIEISTKKTKRNKLYYDKIRKDATEKLNELFNLIDVHDFTNALESCFIEKINLKEYYEFLKKRLGKHTLSSIPSFDFSMHYPIFKHEILSVNHNKDEESLDIVIVHLFKLYDDFLHRNFFLNILFNYYYYFMKEEYSKKYNIEIKNINRIIVYNPLTSERREVLFEDIKGTLAEMDLFRIMKSYIENNLSRTLDCSECEFCENNEFCKVRTRSNNKEAIKAVLRAKTSKQKFKEMI